MKTLLLTLMICAGSLNALRAQELLFEDDFKGRLGEGWSWVREHRAGWRATSQGLEVHVAPGNMWGASNNARNVLVRPAPRIEATLEVGVTVENKPTHQYEQSNLVWYYDDSHMVKIGQELVDGKLSVVMGREEKDQCRTIAIIPLASDKVRVRLLAKGNGLVGQFRTPEMADWKEAGQCTMPAPEKGEPKISLQFYQGPADQEHWARVTEFRMLKLP